MILNQNLDRRVREDVYILNSLQCIHEIIALFARVVNPGNVKPVVFVEVSFLQVLVFQLSK